MERVWRILKRRIHLIMETDLNKVVNELKNEILNGTVLHGYLKWVKIK